MKKYKGSIYIVPILILCLALTSCISERAQYTSKSENTKEGAETNNLTYYEIMKAPYYYEGENVQFKGKVLEVYTRDDNTMIKLAVNNNLNDIFIVCGRNIEKDQEISNANIINIDGIFTGIMKYRSISGEEMDMPGVWMNSVDIIK